VGKEEIAAVILSDRASRDGEARESKDLRLLFFGIDRKRTTNH